MNATTLAFTAETVNSEIRRCVVRVIEGTQATSVKGQLREAARLMGLSVDRVTRFHYGLVKRIEAHEAFHILHKSERVRRAQFERLQLEYEARRLELANSAPSFLARLVPPAVAPLADYEAAALIPAHDDPPE